MKKSRKKAVPQGAISPQELAARWGLHYRTILERVNSGEIPSWRVGNRVRISMKWVDQQEKVLA
jgi:excisionase family DNA binding protein